MKVVFMGTPEISVSVLEAIIKAGHEVVLAVSQPDKPKGRGKKFQPTPVKESAVKAGIPIIQPKTVKDSIVIEDIRSYNPDAIVVIAFGQIIPKEILEMPKYGCINVHTSLLPAYRGAAPIQWAIIDGQEVTGVTTMLMDKGLDTGDILLTQEIEIENKDTYESLLIKLGNVGAKLLTDTIAELEKGTVIPKKQGEMTTEYAKMIDKSMGNIDWNKSAAVIERLVRGLYPWPSAYTKLHGKTMKIFNAEIVSDNIDEGSLDINLSNEIKPAGTIISTGKSGIMVQTGNGKLLIKELQLEGKKRMTADAFLRGYEINVNESLN
jgi:methionyl-tRNA formyltransferase